VIPNTQDTIAIDVLPGTVPKKMNGQHPCRHSRNSRPEISEMSVSYYLGFCNQAYPRRMKHRWRTKFYFLLSAVAAERQRKVPKTLDQWFRENLMANTAMAQIRAAAANPCC